ncbi:ARID DNA-binding domain-containing protein, partial [Tanacetum coccineum]
MTDMSTKWKRNRSKSDEPHITGSKSFARLCDEETQKNDGVPPSCGGMYCLTRTYQDERVVNAKAGKVVEAIKTMGESSTAQKTRTNGSPFWIDDDLAKVKGPERGGNIRCVGKFPATKKRRVQDPQVPLLKAEVKGLRKDFMSLVAAVKEHIPGLNLSTLISRVNTNMEGDDACNVPDNSLAHNPKNPRSAGASHHPKNSTSTATSAHPKDSRSTATSPHPKNPTSGTRPKNPTSGPSRQCYSYYRSSNYVKSQIPLIKMAKAQSEHLWLTQYMVSEQNLGSNEKGTKVEVPAEAIEKRKPRTNRFLHDQNLRGMQESLLKDKMKEVMQFNSSLNNPTDNNKYQFYRCFKCKELGHINKFCQNEKKKYKKKRMEGIEAPKPTVTITYPETVHFSTTSMVKDTDLT